ncbi:MAG: hypothetical protein AVDCRST_MAG66-2648, partial [uncultured Pseudonocardia sp.]
MTPASDPHRPSLRAAVTASVVHVALTVPLVLIEISLAAVPLPRVPVIALVALLQALVVLAVRRHPQAALPAFVGLDVVGELLGGVSNWAGMVFLVYARTRHAVPRTAAVLAVVAPVLPAANAVAVARVASPADALVRYGEYLSSAVVFVLVVAFAGWWRRVLVRRRERRRQREAAVRRERAMARERERIADELNGVVVGALRRVAALASGCRDELARPAPGPARALTELQAEARAALAAMRRVLVVLRAGRPEGGEADPDREPGAWFPPPSTSGVVLAAATATLAGLMSMVPWSDDPLTLPGTVQWMTIDPTRPTVLVLLTVQIGALGWWRTAPQAAFVAGSLATAAAALSGVSNGNVDTSWLVLAFGLVAGAPAHRSVPLLAVTTIGLVALSLLLGPMRTPFANGMPDDVLGSVTNLVLLAVVVLFAVRQRRVRLARAAAESVAAGRDTRDAVEQERHRIARELHDVVAHYVSAVAVQAGAARTVVDQDPAAAVEAAAHIEDHGRRIRRVLPELADLAPPTRVVPLTASGVHELVTPLRAAGLRITVEIHGTPAPDSGDTGLSAHRILTEALTNVLRHAGAGSSAHVVVEHRPGDVTLRIADTGRAAPPTGAPQGPGLGLVGMRERAHLLGGEFTAGPDGRGGWTVTARRPHGTAP